MHATTGSKHCLDAGIHRTRAAGARSGGRREPQAYMRGRLFGSGTGSPNSVAVSIQRCMASLAFASAASCVSPWAIHPASSGNVGYEYPVLVTPIEDDLVVQHYFGSPSLYFKIIGRPASAAFTTWDVENALAIAGNISNRKKNSLAAAVPARMSDSLLENKAEHEKCRRPKSDEDSPAFGVSFL